VNPNVYQMEAARTECDQDKAASRMESLLPVDPNSPDSLHLMPVRINHAIVGLAGEVGELAQLLERWVYYGQSLSVPDVEEEVGDCLWYIALLCNAVGIPMERAMERNIAKLKARFPHKFTEEAAAKRDPAAERKASDEAMEKAKTDWVSAYADGLKQLTERCGGVSDKPVSEIHPPATDKQKEQAVEGCDGRPFRLLGDPVPGIWVCECGQLNADRRIVCGWCNKRRKGHEDWVCECGHINLAVDPLCAKCEKPRVVESVSPEQPDLVSHEGDSAPKSRLADQENCDSVRPDGAQRDQPNCNSIGLDEAQRNQSNPFGYDEAGEFEDL
jgi:NTP pyrophosphatase (non-canonical NTP hydrolase)